MGVDPKELDLPRWNWRKWLHRNAPDFIVTFQRFPFAIILGATASFLFIALINDWIYGGSDMWPRLLIGLATGAIFATAGQLFCESRPEARKTGLALSFSLPIIAILLLQVQNDTWLTPLVLPAIAVLFLSVAPFTKGWRDETKQAAEDRFWWLNHRAVTSAAVAIAGFAVIALGILAIERSLSLLFGFKTSELFYQIILPLFGTFFVPLFWLSTLPKLQEFDPAELENPDFVSHTIGFLGQFVLAPLLLIYAIILFAYATQIALTQTMPVGILGWMVLCFTITGAATWLILHPAFMRTRVLVRFFRRWWFWTTLVPLGLYVLAIAIRINAYGLTPARVGLIGGGIWAIALTIVFLVPRWRDIRFIPGFALLAFLVFSIGPWNSENASRISQANRLETAIQTAIVKDPEGSFSFNWSEEAATKAHGAIAYLTSGDINRAKLADILARHDITFVPGDDLQNDLVTRLTLPAKTDETSPNAPRVIVPTTNKAVDISATPYVIGYIELWGPSNAQIGDLNFKFEGWTLNIRDGDDHEARVSLKPWIAAQAVPDLAPATLKLTLDGVALSLVVHEIVVLPEPTGEKGQVIEKLVATVFSAAPLANHPYP